jgi:hypothetical protein
MLCRLCTPLLVNQSSVHKAWHRNWGVCTILCSIQCENWRQRRLSPYCKSLYWLYMEWLQLILIQSMPYWTLRKSCCRRNLIKCWLMDYHAQYPTHSPHSTHHVFRGTTCALGMWMHHFKHTSVRLSLIWISMLIFPQCSQSIPTVKTIYIMHICKLCISQSRHSCSYHCYCYVYYHPSLDNYSSLTTSTVYQPPSNDHSNKKPTSSQTHHNSEREVNLKKKRTRKSKKN